MNVQITHMEIRLYNCNYCKKEFLPTRRKIQKFCSNSCRSKSHHQKTKISKAISISNLETKPEKISIDQMSFAGVGNSVAGNLAVEAMKSIFIKDENKPATKADLKLLTSKLERYYLVKNLNPDLYGRLPYFDNELKVIIYK